jgi:DNA polymerase III subunit delta
LALEQLIAEAQAGKLPAVCLLVGSERWLIERAVAALRSAALGEGPAGFNDDVFQGQGLVAQRVVAAARTLPMLAARRFVLVRNLDAAAPAELDVLAEYVRAPSPDSCVVLVGEKLDGRAKLAKQAREAGVWFEAEPPRQYEMPRIALREAELRGHALSEQAAQALADALGTDLAALDDALERLSLYVGAGQAIDARAVEACVAHVRVESVWSLVDAVGERNARQALAAAASLLSDREPPLRILALVARQLRILAKLRAELASGLKPQEATQRAGAPPFKARELCAMARRFDDAQLAHAFRVIAETDVALKGSKVPGARVLEGAVLALCADARSVREQPT